MKNILSSATAMLMGSMIDAQTDTVRVASPAGFSSGLAAAFGSVPFKVAFDEAPVRNTIAPEECDTIVSVLLPQGRTTTGGVVPAIRQLFTERIRKLVLIVPPNVLFANRVAEIDLRREILSENQLECSIMLPEGLFPGFKGAPSLIVLRRDRSWDLPKVHFIDARTLDVASLDKLSEAGKGEALQAKIHAAFDYTRSDCVSEDPRDVCVRGESLLATAHCLSASQQKARRIVGSKQTQILESVANIFRPLLPSKDGGEDMQVLNAAQLSPYGYTLPTEPQSVCRMQSGGKQDPLIHPGDIILNIRGLLGRVGMISPDFEPQQAWVVNQSCIILRPRKREYDARLLYLYLRSEIGQQMLQALDCGATVPMVQIRDLRGLPVILPTAEEAAMLLRDFEEENRLAQDLQRMAAQCKELAQRHWTLTDESASE